MAFGATVCVRACSRAHGRGHLEQRSPYGLVLNVAN